MWVTAKYPQLQGSRVHYGVTATAMLSTDQIQLCKLGGGQPEPFRKPPACGRAVPTHGPFLPSKGQGGVWEELRIWVMKTCSTFVRFIEHLTLVSRHCPGSATN